MKSGNIHDLKHVPVNLLHVELLEGILAAVKPEKGNIMLVGDEMLHSGGQPGYVFHRYQETIRLAGAAIYRFAATHGVAGDNSPAHSHPFQDASWNSLPVV